MTIKVSGPSYFFLYNCNQLIHLNAIQTWLVNMWDPDLYHTLNPVPRHLLVSWVSAMSNVFRPEVLSAGHKRHQISHTRLTWSLVHRQSLAVNLCPVYLRSGRSATATLPMSFTSKCRSGNMTHTMSDMSAVRYISHRYIQREGNSENDL